MHKKETSSSAKGEAKKQRILQHLKQYYPDLEVFTREKKIAVTLPFFESLPEATKLEILILRNTYGYFIQYKFFNL